MECTLLVMAEYANVTNDGKLNILGIFDNINDSQFPTVFPEMYLIVRLTAGSPEYGREFQLSVKLLNQDATQELVNVTGDVVLPRNPIASCVKLPETSARPYIAISQVLVPVL